jgi:Fe-S-cluster containining protein
MIGVTELTKTADIDCGKCSECCKGSAVYLFPELGDKVWLYDTVEAFNPFTNRMGAMLDHRANGECGYLTEKGCGIWSMRPLLCRAYSCVEHFAKVPRPQRRQMQRAGKWTGMWAEGERRFKLTVNGKPVGKEVA